MPAPGQQFANTGALATVFAIFSVSAIFSELLGLQSLVPFISRNDAQGMSSGELSMSKLKWVLLLPSMLLLVPSAGSQEPDYTRPVVEKAMKAIGDPAKQRRLQGFTCQCKGTISIADKVTLEMTGSWSVQGPNRFRAELVVHVNGRVDGGTMVLAGDKGWLQEQRTGKTEKVPEDILPLLQADLQAVRLAQKPGYLRGKDTRLSSLGEMKVNDKDAVGIKVSREGFPDLDLYFDKNTGLPVRGSMRVKEGKNGMEATHSFTFDEYKEFDGIKLFTKVSFHRDDQRVFEMELDTIQLQEQLDDGLFKKP
jgi:hypothetical protein